MLCGMNAFPPKLESSPVSIGQAVHLPTSMGMGGGGDYTICARTAHNGDPLFLSHRQFK